MLQLTGVRQLTKLVLWHCVAGKTGPPKWHCALAWTTLCRMAWCCLLDSADRLGSGVACLVLWMLLASLWRAARHMRLLL